MVKSVVRGFVGSLVRTLTMGQRRTASSVIAFMTLAFWTVTARAEMGPCLPADRGSLICGTGDGAARTIPETSSPSKRLALAWRFTNRPPTDRPNENDPNLESLIVRIGDGAILAKSRGAYWHLGDRYAPRQYLRAAWSPDSRLLIKIAGRVGVSDSAELFTFDEDDSIIGAFDLAKVLYAAMGAEMKSIKDANKYLFGFCYKPEAAIDDRGLIHASLFAEKGDSGDGPIYELTAKATRAANSLDVKVLSVSQNLGPRISVTVH
jgi:hypothetical protein